MRPAIHLQRSQTGFSMVELMVSTVIGLLLTSAMLAAFVASARTYQMQDAMAEVQEGGRYALSLLLKDLRQSGATVAGGVLIVGLENEASQINAFETSHSDNALVITPAHVDSEIVYLPGLKTASSEGRTYYIGNSGGIPSLYRNNQPLVEGVAGLVMEYGIDSDADQLVDSYNRVSDMSAADWDKVISARFYLLMRSSGRGVTGRSQMLPAPFDTLDTSDRRLYQVYTAIALIRNALVVKGAG